MKHTARDGPSREVNRTNASPYTSQSEGTRTMQHSTRSESTTSTPLILTFDSASAFFLRKFDHSLDASPTGMFKNRAGIAANVMMNRR